MSGFGTPPTLYRAFKAAHGITPGTYRNRPRGRRLPRRRSRERPAPVDDAPGSNCSYLLGVLRDLQESVRSALDDESSGWAALAAEQRYDALLTRLRCEWPDATFDDVAQCIARCRDGLAVAAFIVVWRRHDAAR